MGNKRWVSAFPAGWLRYLVLLSTWLKGAGGRMGQPLWVAHDAARTSAFRLIKSAAEGIATAIVAVSPIRHPTDLCVWSGYPMK